MSTQVTFGSVCVEHDVGADPERVFAAFADATQRQRWGAPSETAAFIVEQDEFRVGGRGVTRCGAKDDPTILVVTHYHVIEAPHLIICTETVTDKGAVLASILKTVEIGNRGSTKITAQIASLIGPEMVENTELGQRKSLANLGRYLSSSSTT